VGEIDWRHWKPVDRATLLFVIRRGDLLLMRKKRGLGAGKINGPGGRIDPGEEPLECALRELREELCVTTRSAQLGGELSFQFVDGYSVHVYVFRSDACEGTPRETPEAEPLWTPLHDIPYGEMWADDRLWLPLLIRRTPFRGWCVFDGDRLLDYRLEEGYPVRGARG
jgi:8-oxo-dGTP diphosphatase